MVWKALTGVTLAIELVYSGLQSKKCLAAVVSEVFLFNTLP